MKITIINTKFLKPIIFACFLLGLYGLIENKSWTSAWGSITTVVLWTEIVILSITTLIAIFFVFISRGAWRENLKNLKIRPSPKGKSEYFFKAITVIFLIFLSQSPISQEEFSYYCKLVTTSLILQLAYGIMIKHLHAIALELKKDP